MSLVYGGYNTPPSSPPKRIVAARVEAVPCQLGFCAAKQPDGKPARCNRSCKQSACKPCCQMYLTRRVERENLSLLRCPVHKLEVIGSDEVGGDPSLVDTARTAPPVQSGSSAKPAAAPGQSTNVDRSALGRSAGSLLVRAFTRNGFTIGNLGAHATRQPLPKVQENKAAVLTKLQGRLIWIRIWNADGSQKTVARSVLIPQNMKDMFDVYADERACADLGIKQRGDPFWVWKVGRSVGDNVGGSQWVEYCQEFPVKLGSHVELTAVRNHFPSAPPGGGDTIKDPAEILSATHSLSHIMEDEDCDQPPPKRVKLMDAETPATTNNDGGVVTSALTNATKLVHTASTPFAEQTPVPVLSRAMQAAPFGSRGTFPFVYTQDMIPFCRAYLANIPKTESRPLAFELTVKELFHPNEARPKYNRSTVDDHVRHLKRASKTAQRLEALGRVAAGRWSIVRDRSLQLKAANTME